MALLLRPFNIFSIDRTRSRNHRVTWFALLELEINKHMSNINVVVINLNSINIFLKYNQLVKHNLEVNWNKEIIWFTKCLKEYKIQHQNILFISKTRKIKLTEEIDK